MNIGTSDISVFDCKITFDTPNLSIKFDLSPSLIAVPASVLSIAVSIIKPNGDAVTSVAWTGAPNTLGSVFSALIPTISNIIMWGYYKFRITLTKTNSTGGNVYTLDKKFNLCSPESTLANTATGSLQLDKDCEKGTVKLSGLSGYQYKQKEATKEEVNATLYYPQESDVPAIKNITYLPLEIDAYIGQFIAKGVVDSTYDFDDLISAKIRHVANVKKEVKCGAELRSIFTGLSTFYEQNKDTDFYRKTMEKVSPILNLVLLGINEDIDVTDKIEQIESILGTDCGCSPRVGQKIYTPSSLRITSNPDFEAVKNAARVHPVYVAPAVVLSSTQSASGLEIGQSITIPLSLSFSKNDAGNATATAIRKDGVNISSTSTANDVGVIMTANPKIYQGVVTYAQGPVKTNNLTEPDAIGQIQSGAVSSATLSFRGYYKMFYGPAASVPATSSDVRAFPGQLENNLTVILNTGNTLRDFILWLPNSRFISSVVDLDALNADLTAQYVSTAFNVNDAGGNAVAGKLYVMHQSIPYSSNHRHLITIA